MRQTGNSWRKRGIGIGTLVVLLAAVGGLARTGGYQALWGRKPERPRVTTAPVRRADLHVVTTAGGRVESANNTVIECEVESLEIGVKGQRMVAGGSSTILSVMPEGSRVRKGDVLCVLDSSDYEELVRQQRMTVERARADYRQAELNFDVAKLAVVEFRDGYMKQDIKTMRGQVAQAKADLERAQDRLRWTERMKAKGYASVGQVSTDTVAVRRAELSLATSQRALEVYERYSATRALRELESQVSAADATLNYQGRRLRHNEERLTNLVQQVENCTIRAPHDGFLIYANESNRNLVIEPGTTVHLRQKLFYLPDLSDMEVTALVHESVIDQVEAGQRARVRVEALPDRELEGHVVSVGRLPTRNWRSDVPYFVSLVQLDTIPEGLRPGMSAEVEIHTIRRDHVLAIPPEALAVEQGQDVCYVAHEDGLERREIKVGEATRDLLEVKAGLEEGEEVVLDPVRAESADEEPALASATPARNPDSGAEPEPGSEPQGHAH